MWYSVILDIKRSQIDNCISHRSKRGLIKTTIWGPRREDGMSSVYVGSLEHDFLCMHSCSVCFCRYCGCSWRLCTYHLPVCVYTGMTPHWVCVDMRVSPSTCRHHSPSLSPRLTVTGRDPSNYLFLDHMQMAEQCGEQWLAEIAWALPPG